MNATDVRASRLNADVWDLTGAHDVPRSARGGPPRSRAERFIAVLAGIYGLFLGNNILDSVTEMRERWGGWVACVSTCGFPYFVWEARRCPLFPDEYLDCAIYLYASKADAEDGAKKWRERVYRRRANK